MSLTIVRLPIIFFSWIARSTSSIMLSNYVLTDESYVEAPFDEGGF